MAKTLAKVLKTDISRLPLRKAAEELRKKGRGRDTMLAHITPREAAMLKARGGSGTINPDTGLPEFDDGFDFSGFDFSLPTDVSAGVQAGIDTAAAGGYSSGAQQPDYVQQPAFGAGVDQASVDATRSTYGQGPYGALTAPQGAETPYFDAQLAAAFPQSDVYAQAASNVDPLTRLAARGYEGVDLSGLGGGTIPSNVLALSAPGSQAEVPDAEGLTPSQRAAAAEKEAAAELEGQPIDLTTKAPGAAGGIQTPFGTLGTKELIAALGLGGLGLNYLRSQQQGKSAAQQLQNAYNTAAAQSQALAQPFMQQGGTQLAQALTGALSPAQQQQLQAGQAAAAQQAASSGGVAGAQAQRAVEDLRQRLLSNQQTMAMQLLGAGTPLIGNAIQSQLAGTTTGIKTQMDLSAQAGQAATGMLGMLAMMYGRG